MLHTGNYQNLVLRSSISQHLTEALLPLVRDPPLVAGQPVLSEGHLGILPDVVSYDVNIV